MIFFLLGRKIRRLVLLLLGREIRQHALRPLQVCSHRAASCHHVLITPLATLGRLLCRCMRTGKVYSRWVARSGDLFFGLFRYASPGQVSCHQVLMLSLAPLGRRFWMALRHLRFVMFSGTKPMILAGPPCPCWFARTGSLFSSAGPHSPVTCSLHGFIRHVPSVRAWVLHILTPLAVDLSAWKSACRLLRTGPVSCARRLFR